MKRILSVFTVIITVLALCSCGITGRYLDEPCDIPENGIITKDIFDTLKKENGIGIYKGISDGIKYEWTVFGSDIEAGDDVNLLLTASENGKRLDFTFADTKALPFPAVLSVTLQNLWDESAASLYKDGAALSSVSVTGSKTTVLNFSVTDRDGEFYIIPDEEYKEAEEETAKPEEETAAPAEHTTDIAYSDGKEQEKDRFNTDPIPAGKPLPVEPGEIVPDKNKTLTCTVSIECAAVLNNLSELKPEKLGVVPSDGIILSAKEVSFNDGESVFDILKRACRENNIHFESSFTPIYNSAYIEGINNLYEFDCGNLSGWMYRVNGWYPNYGTSRYRVKDGDRIELRYTCDSGKDIGKTAY